MKIIFMGTPNFAVPTLNALHQEHEVIAVYTQAPKPAGRGQSETLSPIHMLANQLNIPVYTPKTLRKAEAQAEFSSLKADCAVVIAYGLILPKEILIACPYGCINIHPSLLPKFRGAAPMQRTILAAEKETAMCIMQMDEGIDTGDILLMEKTPLDEKITYLELSDNMANLGAKLLLQVLNNIDSIVPQKQTGEASYATKLTKEESILDWQDSSKNLARKVRALNPWPGTTFEYDGEKIKVLEAAHHDLEHNLKPGTITPNLMISCAEGFFQPLVLQRAGKKALALTEFLRGFKPLP
jgi:methionyl-tRNA formyltransferase